MNKKEFEDYLNLRLAKFKILDKKYTELNQKYFPNNEERKRKVADLTRQMDLIKPNYHTPFSIEKDAVDLLYNYNPAFIKVERETVYENNRAVKVILHILLDDFTNFPIKKYTNKEFLKEYPLFKEKIDNNGCGSLKYVNVCGETLNNLQIEYERLSQGYTGEEKVFDSIKRNCPSDWLFLQNVNYAGCENDLIIITKNNIFTVEVKSYKATLHWNKVGNYEFIKNGEIKEDVLDPYLQTTKHAVNLKEKLGVNVIGLVLFSDGNQTVVECENEDIQKVLCSPSTILSTISKFESNKKIKQNEIYEKIQNGNKDDKGYEFYDLDALYEIYVSTVKKIEDEVNVVKKINKDNALKYSKLEEELNSLTKTPLEYEKELDELANEVANNWYYHEINFSGKETFEGIEKTLYPKNKNDIFSVISTFLGIDLACVLGLIFTNRVNNQRITILFLIISLFIICVMLYKSSPKASNVTKIYKNYYEELNKVNLASVLKKRITNNEKNYEDKFNDKVFSIENDLHKKIYNW